MTSESTIESRLRILKGGTAGVIHDLGTDVTVFNAILDEIKGLREDLIK